MDGQSSRQSDLVITVREKEGMYFAVLAKLPRSHGGTRATVSLPRHRTLSGKFSRFIR